MPFCSFPDVALRHRWYTTINHQHPRNAILRRGSRPLLGAPQFSEDWYWVLHNFRQARLMVEPTVTTSCPLFYCHFCCKGSHDPALAGWRLVNDHFSLLRIFELWNHCEIWTQSMREEQIQEISRSADVWMFDSLVSANRDMMRHVTCMPQIDKKGKHDAVLAEQIRSLAPLDIGAACWAA